MGGGGGCQTAIWPRCPCPVFGRRCDLTVGGDIGAEGFRGVGEVNAGAWDVAMGHWWTGMQELAAEHSGAASPTIVTGHFIPPSLPLPMPMKASKPFAKPIKPPPSLGGRGASQRGRYGGVRGGRGGGREGERVP